MGAARSPAAPWGAAGQELRLSGAAPRGQDAPGCPGGRDGGGTRAASQRAGAVALWRSDRLWGQDGSGRTPRAPDDDRDGAPRSAAQGAHA